MEQESLLRHMMQEKMKYDECKTKDNTYPWECVDVCKSMVGNNHMMGMGMKHECNHYGGQYIPIQSMGPKLYVYVYEKVIVSMKKFIPNMSPMPKTISKDNFNMIVNDCMTMLTKEEKTIKDMMKSRCVENVEQDRVFCPYCGGLLKSVVEVALISSLINGGCTFCI